MQSAPPVDHIVRIVACLAVVAGLAGHACGEEKKAPDPEKVFARKDADKDGSLTLEEFKAGMKPEGAEKAAKRFGKLDANGDGKLSLDEFKAGMKPKA